MFPSLSLFSNPHIPWFQRSLFLQPDMLELLQISLQIGERQKQPRELFYEKKVFLKNSQNSQVFSCEFCQIFKDTFFTKHLRTNASGRAHNVCFVIITLLDYFKLTQHYKIG